MISSPLRCAGVLALTGCALLASLLTACASGPMMPATAPQVIPIVVAESRPTKLHTGDHFAFWLWHDDQNLWHVATTTAHLKHRFQGLLRASGPGTIANVELTTVEGGRHMRHVGWDQLPNGDLWIDFTTDGREDGLVFTLTGPSDLECNFVIDGDPDPEVINIGRNQTHPASPHFVLSTQAH